MAIDSIILSIMRCLLTDASDIHPLILVYFSVLSVCAQMAKGIMAMVSPVVNQSFETVASISNTFHMPFVTSEFPEVARSRPAQFGIAVKPSYLRAVMDIINYYQWPYVIYMYNSDDGESYF